MDQFDPRTFTSIFALRFKRFLKVFFFALLVITSAEQKGQKILNVMFTSVYNSFQAFSLIPRQHHCRLWSIPCFICSPDIKVDNKTSRLCHFTSKAEPVDFISMWLTADYVSYTKCTLERLGDQFPQLE